MLFSSTSSLPLPSDPNFSWTQPPNAGAERAFHKAVLSSSGLNLGATENGLQSELVNFGKSLPLSGRIMCMYIYIIVCMYIWNHIYIYTYVYIYICIHVCIYMYVCMYVCMHAWMDGWMDE